MGYSPLDHKGSDITEWLTHFREICAIPIKQTYQKETLVPGTFLSMEDRIVNKGGNAFLKLRSIDEDMVSVQSGRSVLTDSL